MQYYGNTKEQAIRAAMRDGFRRNEVRAEGVPGDWTAFPDYNAYFKRKKDPRYVAPDGSRPYGKAPRSFWELR